MDPNLNEMTEEDDDFALPTVPYFAEEDDLYTCLNVSKTATVEEITAAYRRFSRIYHPDKHLADKEIAETLFSRIKKAYEILSDPSQRAIYDTIGLEGLESQGHELVSRYQTTQEIREAYERLQREKEERDMERKTNPKSSVTVNVNATEIFNIRDEEEDLYYVEVPYIELTGFHFQQSIEAPLTPRDTLLMSGTVNSHNGRGSGNVVCGLRHTFSNKATGELEIGGSTSGLAFGLKGFSQFGKRFFTNSNFYCQNSEDILRTDVTVAVGTQLDAHSVGTLTWRTGSASTSLVGGYIRNNETNHVGLTLHLGNPHIYGMLQTSHKRGDTKYRFNVKAGTFGAFLEYGIEKKISQYSTVGALMIVGVPHGVVLRLKVIRANQTYVFPIQLSDELIPSAIVYGTLAPLIVYLTVKKLFIEPYERERAKEEKEKKQMSYKTKMTEKRAEAEAAVYLMRNTYDRIRSEEENKDGLIIEMGLYGRIVIGSDEAEQNEEEIINVTVPMQCLVTDSTLIIHKGSKVSLPGFYDPAPGESKRLHIRYRFKTLTHEVVVDDEDEIKIPKKSHQLTEATSSTTSRS